MKMAKNHNSINTDMSWRTLNDLKKQLTSSNICGEHSYGFFCDWRDENMNRHIMWKLVCWVYVGKSITFANFWFHLEWFSVIIIFFIIKNIVKITFVENIGAFQKGSPTTQNVNTNWHRLVFYS